MIGPARRILALLLPHDVMEAVLTELEPSTPARSGRRADGRAAACIGGRAPLHGWRPIRASARLAQGGRTMRGARSFSEAAQDLRFGARLFGRQKASPRRLHWPRHRHHGHFQRRRASCCGPRRRIRRGLAGSVRTRGIPRNGISPADFSDSASRRAVSTRWRRSPADVTLTSAGIPAYRRAATANLAETLGVRPPLGRWFRRRPRRGQPVVISASAWRTASAVRPTSWGARWCFDARPDGRRRHAAAAQFAEESGWAAAARTDGAETRGPFPAQSARPRLASADGARDALRIVARRVEAAYPKTADGV